MHPPPTLKSSALASPACPSHPPRQVLQLEMERLSLGKAAKSDRTAAARLSILDSELSRLKSDQGKINKQWEGERSEMMKVKVGSCVRIEGGACYIGR